MYNINKRTWRLLLGLLVTVILLYIVQRQTTTRFSKGATTAQIEIVNDVADKNAFVTFLCDDVMVIYPLILFILILIIVYLGRSY